MFSAILNDERVTIVDVDINGQMVYIAYIDSSNNLKTIGKFVNNYSIPETIATNVIV